MRQDPLGGGGGHLRARQVATVESIVVADGGGNREVGFHRSVTEHEQAYPESGSKLSDFDISNKWDFLSELTYNQQERNGKLV